MCLIVVAHRASERYPLIVAANRDEDHERPSEPARFWEGEEIIGGRDAVHGGSWLALTRGGRFAAVTNLRGSSTAPAARSRGELVTGFVRGWSSPQEYAADVDQRRRDYGGFHLLVGVAGETLVQMSGAPVTLAPGIYGLSNAPPGVTWAKVDTAVASVRGALETAAPAEVADRLLRILRTKGHDDPTRDLFVHGERYGTRASTVIVATSDEALFVEQVFGPAGVAGARNEFAFPFPVRD